MVRCSRPSTMTRAGECVGVVGGEVDGHVAAPGMAGDEGAAEADDAAEVDDVLRDGVEVVAVVGFGAGAVGRGGRGRTTRARRARMGATRSQMPEVGGEAVEEQHFGAVSAPVAVVELEAVDVGVFLSGTGLRHWLEGESLHPAGEEAGQEEEAQEGGGCEEEVSGHGWLDGE